MKSKYFCSFFLGITTLLSGSVSGQQNLTLYNMQLIPQSSYANPALMPISKVNIGLPALSSTYINFSNSGFKMKDLVTKRADDSLLLVPGNMISKLSKNNYLTTAIQVDLLSFGFRLRKIHYIGFNATEKILFRFRYPKDFMQLVWEGNGADDVIGRELKFNFGVDATHYREYCLNYAVELFGKLTLGTKLKYLYGMENIHTEKSDISFKTDAGPFDLTAVSDVVINTSGLDSTAFDDFDIKSYAFGKKNKGYGADFGAKYKFSELFSFNASITDIGFIKWNTQNQSYRNKVPGATYTYQGISIQQFLDDSTGIQEAFGEVLDSISKTFDYETFNDAYTTKFSPQIYLGATFNLTKMTKIGAIYYSQFFDKKYHPGASFSFNTMAGQTFGFSASYSIFNRSFNNFGLGFSAKGGPTQFYMVSDNVLGMIFPASTKNLNLRMGVNICFGTVASKVKEKKWKETKKEPKVYVPEVLDRDHDSIPDNEDQCPDIYGLKIYFGCPDRDGDSIPDKDDECPDTPGLAAFHGCPDTDNDGVEDRNDSCVTVAGLPQFNGCPDTDGDGIEDKLDSCITAPGLKIFNGCPDTDNDGIPDKEDKCPTKAGIAKFQGCPDTDNDGIEDSDDECPDQPGLIIYLGCPDSDLDGVPDKIDECPDTYGSKENHGCPLVKVQEKYQAKALSMQEQEVLKTAFENLTFESGKSAMKPASLASLDTLASLLRLKPDYKLVVSGHTDNVGNAASNKKLSENRAKSVKTYLVGKGVDAAQITTEGFGSARPVADNKTPEGKAKNRRVELKITK